MTIECSICASNLLEQTPCAIQCGHVYHKNCLENWRQKGSGCPQCRKQIGHLTDLYFPEDNEQKTIDLILKNSVQLNSRVEENNREMKSQLDLLLASVQSLSTSLNELKKDNDELKAKVDELELVGGGFSNPNSEQLKAKNQIIEKFRKENQDLKIQRTEISKELTEIHEQVANSKRTPLKSINGTENPPQKTALTLSLKFDDVSDQLILKD